MVDETTGLMTSEVIRLLTELVEKHGDKPCKIFVPDDGYYDPSPAFDSDGDGDDLIVL